MYCWSVVACPTVGISRKKDNLSAGKQVSAGMQAGRTAEGIIKAITEGERHDNNKSRKRGTSHKRVAACKKTTGVKEKGKKQKEEDGKKRKTRTRKLETRGTLTREIHPNDSVATHQLRTSSACIFTRCRNVVHLPCPPRAARFAQRDGARAERHRLQSSGWSREDP